MDDEQNTSAGQQLGENPHVPVVMDESRSYKAIHDAVFGVAAKADCSVQALIGILEIIKEELMSTIMEDVPSVEGRFEEEELIG